MKSVLQNWTLVLAGGWNVAIFQPPWVARNVFQQEEIMVEVAMDMVPPGLVLLSNHVSLLARSDRLVFGCKSTAPEALTALETAGLRVLELLPHTPVKALGINFGFHEENPGDDLVQLFTTSDLARISDFGCVVVKTAISRRLRVEDRILNISHALEDNGEASISFNFHFDVPTADAAREKLANAVVPCRDLTYRFLRQIHGIEQLE